MPADEKMNVDERYKYLRLMHPSYEAADRRKRGKLPIRQADRCSKRLPTFSDALAVVRDQLWQAMTFRTSPSARLSRKPLSDCMASYPGIGTSASLPPHLLRSRGFLTRIFCVESVTLPSWVPCQPTSPQACLDVGGPLPAPLRVPAPVPHRLAPPRRIHHPALPSAPEPAPQGAIAPRCRRWPNISVRALFAFSLSFAYTTAMVVLSFSVF